jgi:hypothetical protein
MNSKAVLVAGFSGGSILVAIYPYALRYPKLYPSTVEVSRRRGATERSHGYVSIVVHRRRCG